MREIQLLAARGRLSAGDLIALAREAAGDDTVRGLEDLTPGQLLAVEAVLRMLTSPMHVDDYFLPSVA